MVLIRNVYYYFLTIKIECEEYAGFSYEEFQVGFRPSNAPKSKRFVCPIGQPLIYGGKKAISGEFPHMAHIGFKNGDEISFECGGSLISENFVLTAAHCGRNNEKISASVVQLNSTKRNDQNAATIIVGVQEFIKHKEYNSITKVNDIALIKLDRSLEFSLNGLRPACLMTSSDELIKEEIKKGKFKKPVATGWGNTENGGHSQNLLKVELELFHDNVCELEYPYRNLSNYICAGIKYKDTCQGGKV